MNITRLRPTLPLLGFCVALAVPLAARSDEFVSASYDPQGDVIVVTMQYSGTNPDHDFSVKWGACKNDESTAGSEVTAEVVDSQWKDAARNNFSKTVRFPLDAVPCRPATVTLQIAPHFEYTVSIPKAPTAVR